MLTKFRLEYEVRTAYLDHDIGETNASTTNEGNKKCLQNLGWNTKYGRLT
jgi:hypothetical protein